MLGTGATESAEMAVEAALATDPRWGDPDRIQARLGELMRFVVEVGTERFPVLEPITKQLASPAAWSRMLVSPMLRTMFAQALSDEDATGSRDHELVEAIRDALKRKSCPLETPSGHRLCLPDADLPAVLVDLSTTSPSIAGRMNELFRSQLFDDSGADNVELIRPNSRISETLTVAAQALRDTLPALAPSVFRHVGLVAVADIANSHDGSDEARPGLFESASKNSVPGVVFLTVNALVNPWRAAEALLHEACHHKVFDLTTCGLVYREGYNAERSVKVDIPWHPPGSSNRTWTADRVVIACHVYVVLGVFFRCLARDRDRLEHQWGDIGDLDPNFAARRSLDRATFLAAWLLSDGAHELNASGSDMSAWLLSLTKALRAETKNSSIEEMHLDSPFRN